MGATMPKALSFEYKISPNFAIYYITGAHGGVNAQGQVIANFFSERAAIPRKTKHALAPDGKLGDVIEEEKKDAFIRDVLFGASMVPSTARIIGQWLIEKADEFEKTTKKILERENG